MKVMKGRAAWKSGWREEKERAWQAGVLLTLLPVSPPSSGSRIIKAPAASCCFQGEATHVFSGWRKGNPHVAPNRPLCPTRLSLRMPHGEGSAGAGLPAECSSPGLLFRQQIPNPTCPCPWFTPLSEDSPRGGVGRREQPSGSALPYGPLPLAFGGWPTGTVPVKVPVMLRMEVLPFCPVSC